MGIPVTTTLKPTTTPMSTTTPEPCPDCTMLDVTIEVTVGQTQVVSGIVSPECKANDGWNVSIDSERWYNTYRVEGLSIEQDPLSPADYKITITARDVPLNEVYTDYFGVIFTNGICDDVIYVVPYSIHPVTTTI